jgi:hypothetical protein
MRKEQSKYVRYLRLVLGDAMRRANDSIEPLRLMVERGYRWEPSDTLEAMIAADDLSEVAESVQEALERFVKEHPKVLSPTEIERLAGAPKRGKGAVGGIRQAVRFLDDIDGRTMIELEAKWIEKGTSIDKAHEAYFLTRFNGAMKVLRLAWNKMFYATQKPSARRMDLTKAETEAFYNTLSEVRDVIIRQAEDMADETGSFIEIYDDHGDIIFVAQPPGEMTKAELERARKRARAKAKTRQRWEWKPGKQAPPGQVLNIAELSPAQAQAVRELVVSRPGISIRQAAEAVGAEVRPVAMQANMAPNDHSAEHQQDALLFEELWSWDY